MACSQQELSTHIVTAYIGRGDHVRGRQSGERGGREWRQAGAERGRVRYRLLEEAETRLEKLPLVEAEHPEQSLLRLLHRRLICPPELLSSFFMCLLPFPRIGHDTGQDVFVLPSLHPMEKREIQS